MPLPQGATACVKGGRQKRWVHSSGTDTCTYPHSKPTCPEPGENSCPCLQRAHNLPIIPTASCLLLPPVCVILTQGSRSLRASFLCCYIHGFIHCQDDQILYHTNQGAPPPSPAVPAFEVLPWLSPQISTSGTVGFFSIPRTRDLETTIRKSPGDGIQGPSNEEQTKPASQQDNKWRSIYLCHQAEGSEAWSYWDLSSPL